MHPDKVRKFMQLAGQETNRTSALSEEERKLGARLLLSEVLEYVIEGLGITPEVNGVRLTDPDAVNYGIGESAPNRIEMVDGLSDVAYTMYWNALAFGVPLDQAFDRVCDNNLEKFVLLKKSDFKPGALPEGRWHCDQNVSWPKEVVRVEVVEIGGDLYGVGKDQGGKVRKPSTYKPVDLTDLAV